MRELDELRSRVDRLTGENASLREDRDLWRMRWERQHRLTLRWMEALSLSREGMGELLSRCLAGSLTHPFAQAGVDPGARGRKQNHTLR